ncbi:MAG: bidirectional hydrogenase complex protein HoxU [Phycisphaerae bacterium]
MITQVNSSVESLTLRINGKDVSCRAGDTVLQAVRDNGMELPTLCWLEGLTVWGGCRLCMVEIAGSPKLHAACATACQEGMEVQTNSDRLHRYRRMIVELLLAERNHICSVCVSNGHCELQSLAQKLGIDHVRFAYRNPQLEVDNSHDRMRLDHNRCILCTRCVRVCAEVEGARTKDIKGRGVLAAVIHDLDQPWGESETCTSCGKCVNVCPTGALTHRGVAVGEMTKKLAFLPYLTLMREANP